MGKEKADGAAPRFQRPTCWGLMVNGGGGTGKKSSLIQRDSRARKFVGNADVWDIGLGGSRTQGCLPHTELQ